jgi:helix-turn-helix, Psq domain
MATPNSQLLQKDARLHLAKQALQNNQFLSQRKAASSYDITRSTLQNRLNGIPP